MTRRPAKTETPLERICKALEVTPRKLAAKLKVPYADLQAINRPMAETAEKDRDDTWWLIFEYVNTRLGALMAVRHELNIGLQKDRKRRAVRLAALRQREKKSLTPLQSQATDQ